MTKGDLVTTPLGPGRVAYVRYDHLAPADAPMPLAAVSVVLAERRLDPGYAGTLFPAKDVAPLTVAGDYSPYGPTRAACAVPGTAPAVLTNQLIRELIEAEDLYRRS